MTICVIGGDWTADVDISVGECFTIRKRGARLAEEIFLTAELVIHLFELKAASAEREGTRPDTILIRVR